MSSNGNKILCRTCNDSISLDNSACPNCGTTLRGTIPYAVGAVLGTLLVLAAVLNVSELLVYGLLGLFIAATSGYILYERRERIAEAEQETSTFDG